MAQHRDEDRTLITILSTEAETIPFLEGLLRSFRIARPPASVTLHFPAVLLGTTDSATRRRFGALVTDELLNGTVQIRSAGFAGAAVELLGPREAQLEREWGITNPWKWGFSDVFGVSEPLYVPLHRSFRPDGTTHIVLPRYGMADLLSQKHGEVLAGLLSRRMNNNTDENEEPRSILEYDPVTGTLGVCRNGIEAYPSYREIHVLAALADLGSDDRDERDERYTRSVLLTAADRGINRRRVANRLVRPKSPTSPDTFDRHTIPRDLQGGVLGQLTIQEGTANIAFAGGRLTGITKRNAGYHADNRTPPLPRAQGFLQRHRSGRVETAYLETELAAAFAGDSIREVQETAKIEGWCTVETTAIIRDGIPAVLVNQRYTCSREVQDISRASLFELPILRVSPGEEIRIEPAADHRIVACEEGTEVTICGATVSVESVSGSVTMYPGSRRELILPFHFAVISSRDGLFLVYRPVRPMRTIRPGRWTVSFVLSSDTLDTHLLNELVRDATGFTADSEV